MNPVAQKFSSLTLKNVPKSVRLYRERVNVQRPKSTITKAMNVENANYEQRSTTPQMQKRDAPAVPSPPKSV